MISIGYELLDKVTLKKLIIIPRVDAVVMVAVMGLLHSMICYFQ